MLRWIRGGALGGAEGNVAMAKNPNHLAGFEPGKIPVACWPGFLADEEELEPALVVAARIVGLLPQ